MTTTTPVSFANLMQLVFPTYVTVVMEYFATGEGQTLGIHMLYARSAEGLRKVLIDDWGEYFCQDCTIHSGLVLIPEYEDLVPACVREIVKDRSRPASSVFDFSTTLHLKYA